MVIYGSTLIVYLVYRTVENVFMHGIAPILSSSLSFNLITVMSSNRNVKK